MLIDQSAQPLVELPAAVTERAHLLNDAVSDLESQLGVDLRSRISTDHGACGSNRFPAGVIFPLYAHEDRAS
ncbi:hypothetical protein ACFZCY_45205, partial [Streptomyces sp. NPDC007983]